MINKKRKEKKDYIVGAHKGEILNLAEESLSMQLNGHIPRTIWTEEAKDFISLK